MDRIKYIALIIVLAVFASCEKDLKTYSGTNKLQFSPSLDTLISKTFVFDEETRTRDTIYLKVNTIGNLTGVDRKITLEQVREKEWIFKFDESGNKIDSSYVEISNIAEEGVHFVSLSDPEVSDKLVIKADSAEANVPIIILRDPSLEDKSYRLRFRIVENEYFELGGADNLERTIFLSDKFQKPKSWDYKIDYIIGGYGSEKHRFMHESSGLVIDYDFLKKMWDDNSLRSFYPGFFARKLEEYNAAHPGNPLREKPAEGEIEGVLVSFN